MNKLPVIIQGGMGIAVSDWRLAHAVSGAGQLGVVSGTALDLVLTRRLQLGDLGGHMRRALDAFPIPGVAKRILDRYFIEGGKKKTARFATKSMVGHKSGKKTNELLVASNFAEVFLAKEGHSNPVGINFLAKVQAPILPSLYGAMLAGVDYVLMGAGIPRTIPGILDRLSQGLDVEMMLEVKGGTAKGDPYLRFSPKQFAKNVVGKLARPSFLAIVSSHVLAKMLATKANGEVNGFVVELPVAGGHNAPPRKKGQFNQAGEPIYGDQDVPDLKAMAKLGKPFWLAGGFAEPQKINQALASGATGVQVGTAFAYCRESGFDPEIKRKVIERSRAQELRIVTDAAASPTKFPFKVVDLGDTLSDPVVYKNRKRICDLGYLRQAYERDDHTIGWRCSSEPVDDFVRKGGDIAETEGNRCLCNALSSNVGIPQVRPSGEIEPMLITSGDDAATIARFAPEGDTEYSAADVIRYLLDGVPETRS